jgi:hypothetical protein
MTSKNKGSTWAQPPDIMIEEINTFLALIIKMGHDQHGSPKDPERSSIALNLIQVC